MTKTIAVIAVAALAAGCSQKTRITAEEARDALPKAEALQIDTPADAAARTAQQAQALAMGQVAQASSVAEFDPGFGSSSEFARSTYYLAWTVNGGAWWTLTLVRFITLFPPTQCDESSCTWGPWEDASANNPQLKIKRWKLVVTKVEEAHFEYVLSAENLLASEGFLPIVSGVAYPKSPWQGHGEFTISFDNARRLPEPKEDYGALKISYDNENALVVNATMTGARSADTHVLMNTAYEFRATDAGGELQIAFETREGNPLSLSLRSRWEGTGAGRGDARLYTTDGNWTLTGTASECWAAPANHFAALTYDTDPAFGAEADCPASFQTALYSDLVVP